MEFVSIDFKKSMGKIKNMNSVNNGPLAKSVRCHDNFEDYKNAKIPYARIHDASFCHEYGGEFIVDVHRIFRDFDKDENDPESYSFASTDKYLAAIVDAGTEVFYRLGCNIEHYEKCGTYPPKDNLKWAKICEHIILHYTKGWANGFFYKIKYWEIWNEPDCTNADGSNPCWQGSEDEFIELFVVTFEHLKNKFPHLMIGGPSFAYLPECYPFAEKLLNKLREKKLYLDFFSYHCYASNTDWLTYMINFAYELVNRCGQGQAELILNEWNYIKGWMGDEWKYSIKSEKGIKGASFIIAAMCIGQKLPVDMLMYYDARPCCMNGLFDTDTYKPLKGYYSIEAFSRLLDLGTCVESKSKNKDIAVCAATNKYGDESGILLTHYNDDDSTKEKEVRISILNPPDSYTVCYYVLDENRNMTLEKTESYTEKVLFLNIKLPLFTSYYIKIRRNIIT